MAWIMLVVAGILKVIWAYFMKQSNGFTRLNPSVITLVTMIASFALLSISLRTIRLGMAYTVWTESAQSEHLSWGWRRSENN